mmetsp:Transcript_23040/g.53554  ORF Transcript_23040/g.53554 Transcript_23040/m.53554 type:complete len:206 (-) Transcript_23040:152-769(-)
MQWPNCMWHATTVEKHRVATFHAKRDGFARALILVWSNSLAADGKVARVAQRQRHGVEWSVEVCVVVQVQLPRSVHDASDAVNHRRLLSRVSSPYAMKRRLGLDLRWRQLADHLVRDTVKQLLAQRVQRLAGMLSGASCATRHVEVLARNAPGLHLREQLFLLSLAQCTSQEHHTELANKHRASGGTAWLTSGGSSWSGSGGGFR